MDLACSVDANVTTDSTLTRRWLMPDLAMAGAILTLFLCLFLFQGTTTLFRDADAGWHIRVGERILDGGGFPRTDPFSFSQPGQAWFAWEWLADVTMGAAHRFGGLAAVALLYGVAISISTWLWFRLNWVVNGNFFLAAGLASLMLSTASLHWLARPHVFSWIFLLAVVLYAETTDACWRWREALLAAAAGALWANVHASFLLGSVVLWVYAAGTFLRSWLWEIEDRRAGKLAALGCVLLLASFLNPYGARLHAHVLSYLGNAELMERIGEFQSFNFHDDAAVRILLAVLIAAIGGVLCLSQRKVEQFLLIFLLLAMGLRSARMLPLLALVCLPLSNGAITKSIEGISGLREGLTALFAGFSNYSRNVRLIDAGCRGWVWSVIAVLAAGALVTRVPSGFPSGTFPVQAAAAVEKLPENSRLLAPDLFGGYLIYRFDGARKVFFDGRSDYYGAAFMKEYIDLVQVRPGWPDLLARHRFSHALLPNRYSLVPALQAQGWKQIYKDDVTTLLEKH